VQSMSAFLCRRCAPLEALACGQDLRLLAERWVSFGRRREVAAQSEMR